MLTCCGMQSESQGRQTGQSYRCTEKEESKAFVEGINSRNSSYILRSEDLSGLLKDLPEDDVTVSTHDLKLLNLA